jgi:signal transduction histidine kinase
VRGRLPSRPATVLAPLTQAARKRKTLAVDARSFLAADDADRRAIERALHDSVQQRLVALAVELQLVRGVVESEPGEAGRLLEEARANLAAAVEELGAIARRIHPALLDSQGLVPALRMAADAAPVATRIEATSAAEVPPEVALTVYRLCVAALAGVERADDVVVSVGERDGALEFAVDAGGGHIRAASLEAPAGRTELLGGTLEIAPARIVGRIPITRRPDT